MEILNLKDGNLEIIRNMDEALGLIREYAGKDLYSYMKERTSDIADDLEAMKKEYLSEVEKCEKYTDKDFEKMPQETIQGIVYSFINLFGEIEEEIKFLKK